VDGQENQMSTIEESKVYEVQHYINKTEHLYAINLFVCNAEFWEELDPQWQEVISDVVSDYMQNIYRSSIEGFEAEYEQKFIDYGVEIIYDVDKQAFIDQCGKVFMDTYGNNQAWIDLYNNIKSCA
jgi:TRAP-type C4-dicarboxylate transport system substrate-binding protein